MYLNCHTYYSLRFGTFSEEDLLKLAARCRVTALALTDINNTSACLSFIKQAGAYGIHPIVGIDFRNGAEQQFVGLAANNDGFRELNSFLSHHTHGGLPLPAQPPALPETYIIYPFEKVLQLEKKQFQDHEFIGISVDNLRRLPFSVYKGYTDRLVIQQPVTFRNKRDFNAHRLLRAIANGTLLSKLPHTEEGSFSEKMLPVEDLLTIFADFPHIIRNTQHLIADCQIHFGFDQSRIPQNQQLFGQSRKEDFERLEALCREGLPKRYPCPDTVVKTRLRTELDTIRTLNFVSYFLINHNIISYAKSRGFFHVGRGSGANSIVAYLIGITDVDPIELDLYFERFINPYRLSPPDFDIDFDWRDREEITAYIFKKFPHVALLGTYNTFKYRAVVRELGKVFGLPKEEIDQLSSGNLPAQTAGEMGKLVLRYGKLIQGFPNHLSVHASGILILDKPIHTYSATDLPQKGFPTVQFDMHIAEDVGIFKFDILGQRGLAKIKDAVEIIHENRPDLPPVDITQITQFKNDVRINTLLSQGKAIGAYYVESPAMRGLLKKLQVKDYLGLVAASSVIRPGVSSSGMKSEYIRRHRDPERRKDAHPVLAKIMPDTYGIMVYQEDVLKVVCQFAGLDLGEADVIRRGMSGKFRLHAREEYLGVGEKFIGKCRERGYPDELILEVWEQIAGFAGYAFAKGHSASYAVESYQSLYLKCYFPLEFMVAVLNNGGGFYTTEHYIHETRMCGGTVHPPCINKSGHANRIEGTDIYLGLGYLKNLQDGVIQRLLTERQWNGPFASLDDFVDRVSVSLEQLSILIRIGAFRFTGIPKVKLLWLAIFKLKALKRKAGHPLLFRQAHQKFHLPPLEHSWLEDAYDQMELLGFPLYSYFSLISESLENELNACDMPAYNNKNMLLYGILVNTRFNTTVKGDKMRLSTFIDREGEYFDAAHFPDVVDKFPIHGPGVYACYGKITEEFGHFSMSVIRSRKVSLQPDPRMPEEPGFPKSTLRAKEERKQLAP